MRLNFYEYRKEVRKAILLWNSRLDLEWDPFAAAWIAYALSHDGFENNPFLAQLIQRLHRWSEEPGIEEFQRNIGPLSLLLYLHHKQGHKSERLTQLIVRFFEKVTLGSKILPLRDPDQVFLIALGIATVEGAGDDLRQKVLRIAEEQMKGTLKRRLLYAAAIKELGKEPEGIQPEKHVVNPEDIIALLWWSERYASELGRAKWWAEFDNIRDSLVLPSEPTLDNQRMLSCSELAMLYEAVTYQTQQPDPNILFDNYPLHPRVRDIAGSLFKQAEYFSALFEAVKALNKFIQTKTGLSKSEIQLVDAAFGNPNSNELKNARIKFNPLDPLALDYKSQQNEQRGLGYLAYAVFYAFRHPKGHEPKDIWWGDIDPYEALDQLIIISYLMKRVEEATK